MSYTFSQLLWMYLIYSFVGWCAEVAYAAVKRHKFVNRGFVNGPLCPIYGGGAVAVAVLLPELKGNIFFLFLGGMIVSGFLEYVTGRTLEKIFHRKWWDYSGEKFQLDGYVCLKTLLLWGACSVLMICFTNPLLCRAVGLIPPLIDVILLWAAYILLGIDFAGAYLAVVGLRKKEGRPEQVSQIEQIAGELRKTSGLLENALTRRIQSRMVGAFPTLGQEYGKRREKEKKGHFAEGCGFYKLFCLFFIGAFLGDIVETIFCYVTAGVLMSRSSVVFGPFSIVWGLGCALLTWILYKYRDRSDRYIFLFGTVLGGAYEYACSVFTELAFGTVFWDYSHIPFNLGGRINLLYCFFWGIAAVVWMKGIYPALSRWIEKLHPVKGKILCNVLIVFMAVNIVLSALALGRYSARQQGTAEDTAIGQVIDKWFPDSYIEFVYPNMLFTQGGDSEDSV